MYQSTRTPEHQRSILGNDLGFCRPETGALRSVFVRWKFFMRTAGCVAVAGF